jgi:hypothetical protein
MARFHLNLINQVGFVPDHDGVELPDLTSARAEAIRNIRSILAEEVLKGRLDLSGRIEIARSDGQIDEIVHFAEALTLEQAKDGG